jgi:hypothetical protein
VFADDERKFSAGSGSKRSRQYWQNWNRYRDLTLALLGPERRDAVANVLPAKPYGVAATQARIEHYVEPHALLGADWPFDAVSLNVIFGPHWEAFRLRPPGVLYAQGGIVFHKLGFGGPAE